MDVAPLSASSSISGATSSRESQQRLMDREGTNHQHHSRIRATVLLKVEGDLLVAGRFQYSWDSRSLSQ